MFEFIYFYENSDGSVLIGWYKFDNYSCLFLKVSDCIFEFLIEDGDGVSFESWNSIVLGNDDSSDEDVVKDEFDVIRMNDEFFEEDMLKGVRVSFMIF